MIEIRTIEYSEAGTFLRLLCDVFGLDFDRASSVFFADPLFDLERKWALFESGQMVSILTTTGLTFGWGRALGIAGVATLEEYRGRGYAEQLLARALEASVARGESGALLFAHRSDLYERLGFEVVDRVIRGPVARNSALLPMPEMPNRQVQAHYNRWAALDPARLVRTPDRWRFWEWSFRLCEEAPGGYICHEGPVVREAIRNPEPTWAGPLDFDWLGLESLTQELCIPVVEAKEQMMLLSRACPLAPKMFMTDQF